MIRRHGGGVGGFEENRDGYPVMDSCCLHYDNNAII